VYRHARRVGAAGVYEITLSDPTGHGQQLDEAWRRCRSLPPSRDRRGPIGVGRPGRQNRRRHGHFDLDRLGASN